MNLTVFIPQWQLDEDQLAISVGDEFSSWLTFDESDRWARPTEAVQVIKGSARVLSSWGGAELGRHPVEIQVEGGVLYWSAPEPVSGSIEVVGSVSSNNIHAPLGLPETRGVVSRVRMECQDIFVDPAGQGSRLAGDARYTDVPTSYLTPAGIAERLNPDTKIVSNWTGALIDLDTADAIP